MSTNTNIRTEYFQRERLKTLHIPSSIERLTENWYWCGLDDVTIGVYDCPHSTPKHIDSGFFYSVRTQDILGGRLNLESCAKVSEDTYNSRITRAEPVFGDLLYSREGTYFGIAAEVPKDTRVCLGQRMVLIRPCEELINHSFLRWWLNSPVIAEHIKGFYDGSVAERLNLPVIRSLPIALPPISEQKEITRILKSLDDKIELLREQNETFEALAQTLFKRWFINFNFPDENGTPYKDSGGKMVSSEFGEIPAGWEIGCLSLFAEHIKNSVTPASSPNETFYHYSIPAFDNEMKPVAENGEEIKSNKYGVIPRSILVSKLNPSTPRIWPIQDVEPNSVCSTEFQVVKPSKEYFGFAYGILNSSLFRRELAGKARGTSSSHQRVSPADIFETAFVVSNELKVEKAYSDTINPLLIRADQNRLQIQTLTQLRDTLLPRLMKGEIRVSVEE